MQNGFQDFWIAGCRLYFQRDPILTAKQPIIDLGRIEPVGPAIAPQEAILKDSDGGLLKLIQRAIVDYDESYTVTCSNLNLDNLALLFASNPPAVFTQAATTLTDVTHHAFPGRLVKLQDSGGNLIYGVTSIGAVKDATGVTTYTLNTDYEVVSLERGLIRIISGGAIAAEADIKITFTPRAITGNRLINPLSAAATVQGTGILVWGRGNFTDQTVREARFSISPTATNFRDTDFSNFQIKLSALTDLTKATPAGRLVYWLGNLPSIS